MDLALWDLVAPYFLLGDAAGQWHAAFAAIAVEDHVATADELGVVIRGRARIFGDVDVTIDPTNLTIRADARNVEGHPRDDPSRRRPWIDLKDTTIDFSLFAPRDPSATVLAAQASAATNVQNVFNAWDAPPVDPAPSDYPSSAFVLDLVLTSAVLRPPLLHPAKPGADGMLDPDPDFDAVRLTLPKLKARITQPSTLNGQTTFELLSLGAAGLDDPGGDLAVAQAVAMDPPYAFIGPGEVVGFAFRTAYLDLSDRSTPPDVLAQFGFDEEWKGVYFPDIRLFVSPRGAKGLAGSGGVKNLLLGIGDSAGVTGDFELDFINQGGGALQVGARFYRADGTGIGIVRRSATTADVLLPEQSRIVVDPSGGRPPYTTSIGLDGALPVPERTMQISMADHVERTIIVRAEAPGFTPAELTITARRRPAALTSTSPSTTTGDVPEPRVTATATTRGGTPVNAPQLVIDGSTDSDVRLRLSDRSPATWHVMRGSEPPTTVGQPGARTVTVPLAPGTTINVTATGPSTETKCPVYFQYDQPPVMGAEALAEWADNPANTRTREAVGEPPATGWTGGTAVEGSDLYRLALAQLAASPAVRVVGHASFEGDESKFDHNWRLSERRANVARLLYDEMSSASFAADVDEKGYTVAKHQQAGGDLPREWWRAELPTPITVPGPETTGTVVRDPVPSSTTPTTTTVEIVDPEPVTPPKPDFFRSVGAKLRIVRDEFVALEIHGEVDFDLAAEEAMRNQAPGDTPEFQGLGHQNPGDGIVAFRGVFTLNPGSDEWALMVTFGADPSDVDGLAMTGRPAGSTAALEHSVGRNLLGMYALFLPLMAGVAPETPGDAEVGDLVLTGLTAALPAALTATGWFTVQRVIFYGGEVRVLQRNGAWSTAVFADVEVAVSADIHFGGQSIVRINEHKPLTARYKAIGIRFGESATGHAVFHPVFDGSKGYTLDLARNGSLEVVEPLGSILKVVGARVSRSNPLMFEIELGGAADLGVVSLDRAGVRVTFDDPPVVELTALGASVDIPGALVGSGYFRIDAQGFAGRIDLTLIPFKLRVAAALRVENIPASEGGPATAVAVAMEIQLPVAIPLANSGLGIYGFIGLFAMHFTRNEDADTGATKALSWLKRATTPPAGSGDGLGIVDVSRDDLWKPQVDSWAFGLGLLLGTMGTDVILNLKGLVVLELPGPRLLLMMKANVLWPAPALKDANAEGQLLAVVDIDGAAHTLTIGIVIDFDMEPLLHIRIPIEAFFDTDEPENWYLFLGKWQDPVRAEVLCVFNGSGYLMLMGDGDAHAADLSPALDVPDGFVIAAGIHVSMVWGAKPARLYAQLAAGFDVIVGFSPLTVAGKLYARGELVLFVVSLSASAELDVRLGELPSGGTGYDVRGEVCGKIDLFFFDIEGCVDFRVTDGALPPMAIPDLVGGLTLVSRSPALASGTASDEAVDGSLAEAVRSDTVPNWAGFDLEDPRRKAADVPIDAVPALQFVVPPYDRAHPGVSRPTLQFLGTDVTNTSGGREIIRSGDTLSYDVLSVDITPTVTGGPTPATWWTLRPPNEANEGVHLALLSWVPEATPKALVRSETLDERITDRWGTVCSQAAPPAAVLWTFRFEPLGPDDRGWTVDGEQWPDPPNTVRSTPPQLELRVTERWRSGDAVADAARGVAPAEVVLGLVGCPREEEREPEPLRVRRLRERSRMRAEMRRRAPVELGEVTPVWELASRLDRGEPILAVAPGAVATADEERGPASDRTKWCASRILAAPRFDNLEPVPPYNGAKFKDVAARWEVRGFKAGDLADGVVLAPGRFEYTRVLLFVAGRAMASERLVVRALRDDDVADEVIVDHSHEVTWATLPETWTAVDGPWDDDMFLVMQHHLALRPRQGYTPVLVTVQGGGAADTVLIGARDPGEIEEGVPGPFFYVAAVETLHAAEIDRSDYDSSTVEANHSGLEASLGAASGGVALLQRDTDYRITVKWTGRGTTANDEVATPRENQTDSFWFHTRSTPPDRLEPWVLATNPYEAERHVFGGEPLVLSFNTPNVLDVFAAYETRLEVRLQAASSKHPDPAETGLPHPFPLTAGIDAVAASVLSPWEGAVIEAIAAGGFGTPTEEPPSGEPCIAVDETRVRHSKVTIPIPLHPVTDYLLDVERVPISAPAGTRGQCIFRRSFTTSRFATLPDLAQFVQATSIVHRYAPLGAIAQIAAALPSDIPEGPQFDKASEDAGLGRIPVPELPRLVVFWETPAAPGALPQPTGVLVDCSEPVWRGRERATLVPVPNTDVKHYELTVDPWLAPEVSAESTAGVARTIRAPGGQRGLFVLQVNQRGNRLKVHLRRTRFTEPYLDGPGPDEVVPMLDVAFLRAPWEEEA